MAKDEILVVGGGLVGTAAALRLANAGHDVTLVDPGDMKAAASFGNAGLVAIEAVEPLASWSMARGALGRLYAFGGPLDMCWRDADLWLPWGLRYLAACRRERFKAGTRALTRLLARAAPAWRELLSDAGRPELLRQSGHFQLWESDRTAREGLLRLTGARVGQARWRPVSPVERDMLAGRFNGRVRGGVYFENTASLADPGATLLVLRKAFREAGGVEVHGRVARIETRRRQVMARLEAGGGLTARQAVIAAGAWSRGLMRQLGVRAPLIAERGYHLHFPEHDWPQAMPPLFFEDRFVYLAPFVSGLRITSFTELGRPGTPPDRRKWRALRRHAADLGAPVRGAGTPWQGSRPTLPDFLPAIGRLSPEVIYAFGHQHIGVTLAAATAEAVEALAAGDPPPVKLGAFDVRRFG